MIDDFANQEVSSDTVILGDFTFHPNFPGGFDDGPKYDNILMFVDHSRSPNDIHWMGVDYLKFYQGVYGRYMLRSVESFQSTVVSEFSMPQLSTSLVFSFGDDSETPLYMQNFVAYDCLQWLIDYCFKKGYGLPVCVFHSPLLSERVRMQELYDRSLSFQEL